MYGSAGNSRGGTINRLFYIQLVTSFVVGGGFIALLSFTAERAGTRAAGIVLAVPSTAGLGFFFLGWALSSEAVARIIPATLIPLGLAVLFPALYTYAAGCLSRVLKNKALQIAASFLVSISAWFVLSIPIALYELNSLAAGLAGYFLFALVTHSLLRRRHHEKPAPLTYTRGQKIGRAAFAGFIIALVVFLGKTLSPFWGGVFAMFPAALVSSLMILHWYYDPESLFPTVRRFALGSAAILVYALTVMLVFPVIGFIAGTAVAYLASLAVSLVLSRMP